MYMRKVVIFGGGSGLSQLLKGLKQFPMEVTAATPASVRVDAKAIIPFFFKFNFPPCV